jgi:hypothetical protein
MKLHSIFRTRNINVAIFAMAVSLLPVIQSPMAFAEEISFDCPGGGKYIVADGAVKTDWDHECLGDVVLDDSVTKLDYVGFFSKATSITIPATTLTISDEPLVSSELLSINVASANPNYKSVDGVLYSKDGATLILYPTNKVGESFTIADDVTTIQSYAFGCLNNLKNLTLSDSVTEVGQIGMVNGCNDNSLESYSVGEGNENYSTIDGVLFDKEATLQIAYPKSKPGENYDMVSSVTKLQSSSFGYNRELKTIKLSENLETIGVYSFNSLNLATLHIPASVQVIAELGLDSTNSVTVDPENPNFVVSEGNLFNPDMTTLLVYFNDDSRTSYTVPSTVTSLGGYAFGNNDARSLVRLTFNTPLEEAGTVTGGPTKFLNLGNDFKLATHFENSWYFRELKKVNYCGNDAETIKDLNAQIVANWTTATLVCETAPPAEFSLSSQRETVVAGTPIMGYTITSSDSSATYSIYPQADWYGLSFDPATGLLTGSPAGVDASTSVVFKLTSSNSIGDASATFTLTVDPVPVPVVVEPTPEPVVPISEVVEPTPVVISPVAKSTYFAVTTSTKNLSRVAVTKAATTAKVKLGKSLQFMIASVGKKAALVKVSVKDPSGKSYSVASKSIAKNKSYSSPIMKFSKVGKYTITTFVGSAKKVITVTVSK